MTPFLSYDAVKTKFLEVKSRKEVTSVTQQVWELALWLVCFSAFTCTCTCDLYNLDFTGFEVTESSEES